MIKFKPLSLSLSLPLFALINPLLGQSYDLLLVERNVSLTQTGPNTTEAPSWRSESGNYFFYSEVEISGATPASLSVTNGSQSLPFNIDFVATVPLEPYFYDGFDVASGTFDINSEVGSRQGGGDAPVDWLANSTDQTTDFHQQAVGPVLQLAGDGGLQTVLVSPDLDFTTKWNTTFLGGKKVQTVINVFANQAGGEYYTSAAMTIGSSAPLAQAGQAGSGFSVVLIEDTFGGNGNFIQVWYGDTIIANDIPNPSGAGDTLVEIYADDPVDFDPWDGSGSTLFVAVVGGEEVARYEVMNGGVTSNYVTLEGFMQANGAQLATHTFEEFLVSWGTTNGVSLPVYIDQEVSESFTSEANLLAAIPAASYDFVSDAGTVDSIAMGGIALPSAQPVNEYTALQSIDPAQEITITWDAYTKNAMADDAILTAEIVYWDENLGQEFTIWETPETREGGTFPGIDPTSTSLTFPANTFTGSPSGFYNLYIYYSDVMSFDNQGSTNKVWLESVELHVPVGEATGTWAGYPLNLNSQAEDTFLGWIDASFADDNWIYVEDLTKFIFVREADVTPEGSWIYIPN